MALCCRTPSIGTMNPSDFQYSQKTISPVKAYRSLLALHNATVLDLPPCTINLPHHATPTTPEDLPETLIVRPVISAFPFRQKGQHPQLVNEANTDSLALRPGALPARNLQRIITHTLLRYATGVNEQFPGRDFNPLD